MTLVRDADKVRPHAVLAQGAHHHFGLINVDARIHDAVRVQHRHIDLIRLTDGRILGVVIAPALLGDVAVFNPVRRLEPRRGDVQRRHPVRHAVQRRACCEMTGEIRQHSVHGVPAIRAAHDRGALRVNAAVLGQPVEHVHQIRDGFQTVFAIIQRHIGMTKARGAAHIGLEHRHAAIHMILDHRIKGRSRLRGRAAMDEEDHRRQAVAGTRAVVGQIQKTLQLDAVARGDAHIFGSHQAIRVQSRHGRREGVEDRAGLHVPELEPARRAPAVHIDQNAAGLIGAADAVNALGQRRSV